MGRKKKPELEDKKQSDRFIEAAKQLEGSMNKEEFKAVVGKILKAPKKKKA